MYNIWSFSLDGFEKFDEFHEKGYIDRVITTDLTYLPPAFYEREYFTVADMSKFIALIIDSMNHDVSISSVLSPTDRLHALLERHRKRFKQRKIYRIFLIIRYICIFIEPPVNSWRSYFH